jgi:hypothetical protein
MVFPFFQPAKVQVVAVAGRLDEAEQIHIELARAVQIRHTILDVAKPEDLQAT